MKSSRMTTYILVVMILGIAFGAIVHTYVADPAVQKTIAGYVSIGGGPSASHSIQQVVDRFAVTRISP